MTQRLNKEMENRQIRELKREIERLRRREYYWQTRYNDLYMAFKGAIQGFGRIEI